MRKIILCDVPVAVIETRIQAPPSAVFDLARSIHAHTSTASGNEIVLFAAQDFLQLGDEVEFEATHLGFRHRLRAKITAYDRPEMFVDEQVAGPFRNFRHKHEFKPTEGGTLMRDTFEFEAFCGGILLPYMKRFLTRRAEGLRQLAEAQKSGDPSLPK